MKQPHHSKKLLLMLSLALPVITNAATPLPNDYCTWLYNQALDTCKTVKSADPSCANPHNQLPSAIAQALFAFSNHPSYVAAAFANACVDSCKNNQKPEYNTFAVAVCSYAPNEVTNTTTNTASSTPTPLPIQLNADIAACGIENNWDCLNNALRPAKKQLNQTYQALAAAYNDATKNMQLDTEQRTWLDQRNLKCGKLEVTTPANTAPATTQCILEALEQRTQQLSQTLATLKNPSIATGWYQSTAKPVLVVRDKPDVAGKKIGTVPDRGKVHVLTAKVKADSISGLNGHWVKIEWLSGSGYVFDGFLKPLE
ncbi:MAG: lysozyme inhibitor LprI family protein [Thiofilum sp.]|uniref:lysozyme inhibitor LprI family protein n=1 Tax=Thiofilum sp. TaxID=2212733 RepID=UPI0025F67830|nr:lysozyme inhibitor LprI family protein [Thiofilum sp.]MBK8455540.1 DUF1311 domain-containing protein [Thiofilum sp.]